MNFTDERKETKAVSIEFVCFLYHHRERRGSIKFITENLVRNRGTKKKIKNCSIERKRKSDDESDVC